MDVGYGKLVFRQDRHFPHRPRLAMSVDRIEIDIAAMNRPSPETATEPDTSGFDVHFTLEPGYTALDRVALSGSTSSAAS